MFGSDWPVCLLAGSYEHVVKIIDLFIENLEQEEKNNIMEEMLTTFIIFKDGFRTTRQDNSGDRRVERIGHAITNLLSDEDHSLYCE